MGALLTTLVNAITGGLVALFGSWRIVLYGILVSIIGIVVYNLIVDVVDEVLQYVLTSLNSISGPSGGPSSAYQFAGLGAYLAHHLKIVECLSFIINVILVKWIVAKIPFIKW